MNEVPQTFEEQAPIIDALCKKTGKSEWDCRRALTECDWNFDAAIQKVKDYEPKFSIGDDGDLVRNYYDEDDF